MENSSAATSANSFPAKSSKWSKQIGQTDGPAANCRLQLENSKPSKARLLQVLVKLEAARDDRIESLRQSRDWKQFPIAFLSSSFEVFFLKLLLLLLVRNSLDTMLQHLRYRCIGTIRARPSPMLQ